MNSRMSWAGAAVMMFTLGGCASQQGARQTPSEVPAKAEAPSSQGSGAAVGAPQSEEEKMFYALGVTMGRQFQIFDMSPGELAQLQAGLRAEVMDEKPEVDMETYGPKLSELARVRGMARAEKEKEKSRSFLEQAAKEPGAVRTESGLIYTPVTEGTGARPAATDTVEVHYRGTLADGTEFDNSYKRGEPARFPLNSVIRCWTEGVQMMKVGGKARLLCPSDLAYGDRGTPGIPGGAVLAFEVELLGVQQGEQPAGEAAPSEPEPAPAPAPKGKKPARK
ncbi:FKBP-type peptidyl-prolyl cis-trans isomerase [Archangium gephyra]|uniref:FKBP-type peptidyl-prolyl cis-trans isomerase n=1 Tax=Archangium gephyra TaxID=48 RepID=UPI003B78C9E1